VKVVSVAPPIIIIAVLTPVFHHQSVRYDYANNLIEPGGRRCRLHLLRYEWSHHKLVIPQMRPTHALPISTTIHLISISTTTILLSYP